jgi:hypothetical protein
LEASVELLKRVKDMVVVEGTEGRNPFEVFVLLWAILVGASLVFGSPAPGSLQELLPQWMVTGWSTLLCIGGLVGLVGVWLRNLTLSLLVERAAMLTISPAALLYSVALFSLGGARAAASGGAVLVFALSSFVRILRISTQLKRLRELLSKAAET